MICLHLPKSLLSSKSPSRSPVRYRLMGRTITDLTGRRFGLITVIRRDNDYIDKNSNHTAGWWCRCDCGTERRMRGSPLYTGGVKSCGCMRILPIKYKDLTGKNFGNWTVIRLHGFNKHGSTIWWCRCKCGVEKPVIGVSLRTGVSKSCGCYKRGRSLRPRGPKVNRVGQRFGFLTVVEWEGYTEELMSGSTSRHDIVWLCKCDCGNTIRVRSTYLQRARSCGCKGKPPGKTC